MSIVFMLTLALFYDSFAYAEDNNSWLNRSYLDKGIIGIEYNVQSSTKTKLQIAKGADRYTYNLTRDQQEFFPLQLGNGEYVVSIVEQVSGTKYKVVAESTVTLHLNDSNLVYLNSVQNVNWNDTNQAIIKAKELTKNKSTDIEKVTAIYHYIISNIKYDQSLMFNVTTDYLPQIDNTLLRRQDICYGYASLFAAMLRSENIPTKLVMGNSKYVKTYHAWNEVFIDGRWITIDTTVDAGWNGTTTKFDMIKDNSNYVVAKQY